MSFLKLLAVGILIVFGMMHFNLHANHTLVAGLGGLAGASFVVKRQLEKAKKEKLSSPPVRRASAPVPAMQIKPAQISPSVRTTVQEPFVIPNPALGLVNLMGDAGHTLLLNDLKLLGDLFPKNVHVASQKLPKCNVLFLYCTLESSGRIAGQQVYLRDVIKAAGAHIVVIAAEVADEVILSPDFQKHMSSSKQNWPANIVFTLNRNGEKFGIFFQRLFAKMCAGITMPVAWVTLAPQGPNQQCDGPGTIAMLEGGHVTFSKPKLG